MLKDNMVPVLLQFVEKARKNKYLLCEDRERDSIEIIKCMGDHIYPDDAKTILDYARKALKE